MSSEPAEMPQKKNSALPQSIRASESSIPLVGILVTKRQALVELGPGLRLLDEAGVGTRIFVMPQTGAGKFAQWAEELRQAGGVALWAAVTDDLELVHKAATFDVDLPLFCQFVGADNSPHGELLIQHVREIAVAVFAPGRAREAAYTLAKLAAVTSSEVASRLAHIRESAEKAAQKNSEYISANVLTLTAGEPTRQARPPLPPLKTQPLTWEDQELLSRSAEGMKQPRISSKANKAEQQETEKPKPLEYSLPLRQILTASKEIATAYRNVHVQAEHLLAAIIDTPDSAAHQVLVRLGVNLEALAGHLVTHFAPPHEAAISGMFSMGESTWAVLEQARAIARERQRPALTSLDFLESIATRTSSGATSALWDSGLAAVQLKDAIDGAEAEVKTEYASIKPKRDEPKPTGIDPEQARKMEERLLQKHAEASSELRAEGPSDVPAPGPGFSPEPKPKPEILVCDPNNPDIDSVERAADALLEGRLVAFPIDTMYALAADATNPAAVERIRTALQRDHSQHFGALIHSTTQLKHLVKPVPAGVLDMLDELWPGPLTVVFDRHPNRFAHLSNEPTLGLRIPSDYLSLAILSTVGRPLAATSIKLKDGEGARQVAEQLAGVVDVVIDTKQASEQVTTTVISVREHGPKILRLGATKVEVIDAHMRKLQDG